MSAGGRLGSIRCLLWLAPGGCRALLWLPALLGGCATDDVVVAELPADSAPPTDGACANNDACLPVEFCSRESCGDPWGRCERRDVLCEDQGAPSCGCDGVTYWNDCLRRQYGTTASTPGGCVTGVATCAGDNALDCPVLGAACAKLLPPGVSCPEDTLGACWVLPVACPPMGPPDLWIPCGGKPECNDTCGAIRSGRVQQRALIDECMRGIPGH